MAGQIIEDICSRGKTPIIAGGTGLYIESLLNDLTEHWKEYFIFLENQKISKICEFYGDKTAPFDDELREVIAANLKSSLNGVTIATPAPSKIAIPFPPECYTLLYPTFSYK